MDSFWTRCQVILAAILTLNVMDGQSASILAFLPFGAKSHYIVYNPVLKALAEKGHQVTAYVTLPMDQKPAKNYNEIVLPDFLEDLKKTMNFSVVEFGRAGFFGQMMALNEIGLSLCESCYKTKEFRQLMKTKEKYDLVISESLFSQSSVAALAHRFDAHQIVLMPLGNSHWTNFITSNPYSPSYIPDYNSLTTWNMNFLERLHNSVISLVTILVQQFYYMQKFQAQVDEYFVYENSEDRPPLTQLLSNISLVIENSHQSLNGATPKAPNFITVGGLNIKQNKPLPPKLKKWLDESKDGCIYFSYGTVVQGGQLDASVRQAYISAFAKLKQRVLWKLDRPQQMPSNVLTDTWMPQQDILAHPKVVLFITHGGYLSMNEAVHYGIPLIGTPFFGDQGKNLKAVTESGYGIQLDYDNITETSVLWAINEILGNTRYKEAVKRKSLVYRDRQNAALDTALYWIEYVLRHNGAPHLRPYSAFMPWYQAELLDVAALALCPLVITLLMLRKLYLFLTCQTCRRGQTKQSTKNKKHKTS